MDTTAIRSIGNAAWYGLTRRHRLEGRYDPRSGKYHNWDSSYIVEPGAFLSPETAEELRSVVLGAARIGLVGAGHTFNDLHLHRSTLVSLDKYAGLVSIEPSLGTATFRAGTRMRDLNRILDDYGLALPVLPDHNAQSLGGILGTDVHASGHPAHVSQAVRRLLIMDGLGRMHDVEPENPVFRAAIGGMGCTGVILEATLQCRPSFRLRTAAFRCSLDELLDNLDDWVDKYEHLAAGYIPAIEECIVEVKSTTHDPLTRLGSQVEDIRHVTEAIGQAIALPLTVQPGVLGVLGGLTLRAVSRGLDVRPPLVLPSWEGFNRNVYHIHKEVEFTCSPQELTQVIEQGRELLRRNSRQHYYLLGLRRAGCNPYTLIGPGAGPADQDVFWIAPHLFGNVTDNKDDGQWRQIIELASGRPHYGKNMVGLGSEYLSHVHGENWAHFLDLVAEMDPEGKFANPLVALTSSEGR